MSALERSVEPPSGPPRSVWFLAVGATLVLLGAVALGATVVLNVASLMVLGPLFLANSVCQLILMAFRGPLRGRLLHLSSALLSMVVGFLILAHGDEAGTDVALLLAAFLLVAGSIRIAGSWDANLPAPGWLMATGVLALALAFCVWAQAPTRGLWLISICVALDFLGHGATWLWFSMLVRGKVEPPIPESEIVRIPVKKKPEQAPQ